MAIIRYSSGGHVRSLLEELDHLVSSGYSLTGRQFGRLYPGVDIIEELGGYRILADLPGMSKDEIGISVDRGMLTISGEKKSPEIKTEKKHYYHLERGYGKFSRSFNLPSGIDNNSIEAHYADGVLNVFLKKSEPAGPKTITVET